MEVSVDFEDRKWFQVILWWELRRLLYNLILGTVGMIGLFVVHVTIPLIYLLIGFMLNLFYTFGWISELFVVRKLFPEQIQRVYPKRFFLIYLLVSIILLVVFQWALFGMRY